MCPPQTDSMSASVRWANKVDESGHVTNTNFSQNDGISATGFHALTTLSLRQYKCIFRLHPWTWMVWCKCFMSHPLITYWVMHKQFCLLLVMSHQPLPPTSIVWVTTHSWPWLMQKHWLFLIQFLPWQFAWQLGGRKSTIPHLLLGCWKHQCCPIFQCSEKSMVSRKQVEDFLLPILMMRRKEVM